nr:ribonuclease H-like domain-containing protein [Tanacetum cinerariifolium]
MELVVNGPNPRQPSSLAVGSSSASENSITGSGNALCILFPTKSSIGNPQQKEYKEKGVIDNGCSRHMTGNKCYLTDFEAYDGGFVSFRDGKGRISGKGKIKTGKLDFDDVYFFVAGNQTNGIVGSKENLVAVVAGNQTNGIVGSKENLVAGTKDGAVDAGKKAPEVDETKALDNGGKNDQVPISEVESLLQQERQTENINSTNSFNTVSSPVNTVGSSFVNAASHTPLNAAGPSASTNAFKEHSFERFSPFKKAFSLPHVPIVTPIADTGIFRNAYDDEVLEGEVDMNNVDSSYTILKATKFLKDRPQEQVIGSFETPIQIR